MTIRRALLLTLLAFSISFAALMTALSYSRARAALSDEIRLNLETQALTLMQQVDAMLFERVKDMQGWRRLDLMQEVRVGDVDKRLARFLDASTHLMQVLARACGHASLSDFSIDDLSTWKKDMAELTGVRFAGGS